MYTGNKGEKKNKKEKYIIVIVHFKRNSGTNTD